MMPFHRGAVMLIALSLTLALAAGCGSNDTNTARDADAAGTSGGQGERQLEFYSVIHIDTSDPFWAPYYKGARDAARQLNVEMNMLAPRKASVPEMVDLLNSAVAAKPDGIVTTVPDAQAQEDVLRRAIDQGIPVVALNTPDTRSREQRIPYLFYVGSDERLAGERAAERLLQERRPRRAVCAIPNIVQTALANRCGGFTDVMRRAGVPTDRLALEPTDPTRQAEQIRGYFRSHDDTDALLTLAPNNANPAIDVLEQTGLAEKVIHGSFDLSTEQINAIQEGKLLFTIDQQQYLQTYLGVQMLAKHVRNGFTLASDILTGPAIIDRSNVEQVVANVEAGYR
jgi:simple sugar transport system substrate-binding protein